MGMGTQTCMTGLTTIALLVLRTGELETTCILNQTYNATRKWLNFCMNMWCRAIYLKYIAQLLIKNLWCTVSKVSTARFTELISDWSKWLFGSQVAKRLKI